MRKPRKKVSRNWKLEYLLAGLLVNSIQKDGRTDHVDWKIEAVDTGQEIGIEESQGTNMGTRTDVQPPTKWLEEQTLKWEITLIRELLERKLLKSRSSKLTEWLKKNTNWMENWHMDGNRRLPAIWRDGNRRLSDIWMESRYTELMRQPSNKEKNKIIKCINGNGSSN